MEYGRPVDAATAQQRLDPVSGERQGDPEQLIRYTTPVN